MTREDIQKWKQSHVDFGTWKPEAYLSQGFVDFLLTECDRMRAALLDSQEKCQHARMESYAQGMEDAARACMDEALQFAKERYHPEKRGTATQIAACIQVRFGL